MGIPKKQKDAMKDCPVETEQEAPATESSVMERAVEVREALVAVVLGLKRALGCPGEEILEGTRW